MNVPEPRLSPEQLRAAADAHVQGKYGDLPKVEIAKAVAGFEEELEHFNKRMDLRIRDNKIHPAMAAVRRKELKQCLAILRAVRDQAPETAS